MLDEFARGEWYGRFVAAFPEARGGQRELARIVAALGWRVIEGSAGRSGSDRSGGRYIRSGEQHESAPEKR